MQLNRTCCSKGDAGTESGWGAQASVSVSTALRILVVLSAKISVFGQNSAASKSRFQIANDKFKGYFSQFRAAFIPFAEAMQRWLGLPIFCSYVRKTEILADKTRPDFPPQLTPKKPQISACFTVFRPVPYFLYHKSRSFVRLQDCCRSAHRPCARRTGLIRRGTGRRSSSAGRATHS